MNDEVTRKSTEVFHSLLDYAADAIILVSDEALILAANKSAAELLYFSKEELLGMDAGNLVPEEAQDDVSIIWDTLKENDSLVSEIQLKRKDGSLIQVEVSRKTLPDGNGTIAVVRDITARKRVEAELAEHKAQLALFIEHSPAALAMFDADMNYLTTSRRWLTDYGLTGQQVIGKSYYEVSPETALRLKEVHERCLKGAREVNEEDFFMRANGNLVWLRWEIHPWHKASGEIGGIMIFTELLTERKKATLLFNHHFENSPDTILVVNRGLKIESINKPQMNGHSSQDIVGKTCMEVFPEESREVTRESVESCFVNGKVIEIENKLSKDRWVRSRFVPIVTNGLTNYIMIIASEITERRQAEEQLRKSEERHRALVENISDGLVLIDKTWNVVYQSPSVERIVGFTIADRKGRKAVDFVHPDDRDLFQEQYKKARNSPGMPVQGQYRTRHKHGYYIWIEVFVVNLLHNRAVESYVVVYRDVSERHKFEEQQLLMSSIVNSSDDAIISKTLDGIVTSWNEGAEKVLGFVAKDIIGKSIDVIIPAELYEEEAEVLRRIREGKSLDHVETQRAKKDGTLIDVSLTISPIKDSTGKVVGASEILRDITESKKSEAQLRQQNEKLSEVAFLQSHIVRGPLTTILGLIDLIDFNNPADPENLELLPMLQTVAKELDVVIHEIVQKTWEIKSMTADKGNTDRQLASDADSTKEG